MFLGLTLDETLKFQIQISASAVIFVLRNLARMVFIIAYGQIYSHLMYPVPIWGKESHKKFLLIKLQKKDHRVMFSLKPRKSYKSTFRVNKIFTIPSIYILETLIFVKQHQPV